MAQPNRLYYKRAVGVSPIKLFSETSTMKGEINFNPEDQQFVDQAVAFCQRMGERAVLC